MFRYGLFLSMVFLCYCSKAQPKTDSFLEKVLAGNADPVFIQVLTQPNKYRLQVIYTQINRDKNNNPIFKNYYFNYDPLLYFNPASMVKLPLALLSLEKLNKIRKKEITKYTRIAFDSSKAWHKRLYEDTTSKNNTLTIAHLIKRALLISENDPYNRMYQFVGQGEANKSLQQKGYTDVRITRQFLGLTPEQNRHTNPVHFLDGRYQSIYSQPPAYNSDSFDFSREIRVGKAHMNRNDSLIYAPFDFTQHNALSLQTMQQMLQSVMFPKSVPLAQRFRLTKEDHVFLWKYLSQYPSETDEPKYDTGKFFDSYVKFFFRDSTRRMPSHVRVFNKVGWSYGFITDISYVADFKNRIEFMLAATLYVNSDEIVNDGKYDYTTIGYPFLYQLGQTIYKYEIQRKRNRLPDLSSFRIKYDTRNPADKRPTLTEVDN